MNRPIVVKVGGEVVMSPYMSALAADIAALRGKGEPILVVHGGGPQVTDLQTRLGQVPHVVAGRRVTDAETLDVIEMVVAGKVNVAACAALLAVGAMPVGLHGASALVIAAEKRPPRVVAGAGPDPIDFGRVGDVTGVNRALLGLLCDAGYVPVVACLGANAKGERFNINADVVANQLAAAVFARALVVVSDVRGVLRDLADPSSRIPRLSVSEGRQAIADGVVTKGMIPKLEESFAALAMGVGAVHILGRPTAGDLAAEMASPGSVGTALHPG